MKILSFFTLNIIDKNLGVIKVFLKKLLKIRLYKKNNVLNLVLLL